MKLFSPIRYYIFTSLMMIAGFHLSVAQIGGHAGEFTRTGFGARGIGMGNALTAVTTGDVVGHYNPAVLPWAEYRNISASFGALSLDRSLNFISFTQPLAPNAGIAAGIINSGVSDIDGRDLDGEQTGFMKTSENQVFLAFSTRLKVGISIGVLLKLNHYHLYTDMNALGVGADLGILFPLTKSITLGGTIRDINSEYKWDSTPIYGRSGTTTKFSYPQLYTIGGSYKLPDSLGVIAADFEMSTVKTLIMRLGTEVILTSNFAVRAGLDRIDLKEKGNGVRPSFGFSARNSYGSWTPSIHYAYVIEPFSPSGIHMISVSVIF